MNRISVIGSLNMDLVIQTERMPLAGETISGRDFNLIPGGKGANQAIAAAKAGGSTSMFGCVGDDEFGEVLLNSLKDAGVNTTNVSKTSKVRTGVASIILESSGENRIIIISGANHLVDAAYVDSHWDEIGLSSLILLQHEIPLETCHYIIEKAHASSIPVLLNPAPFHEIPTDILKKVDYLVVNEIELQGIVPAQVSSIEDVIRAGKEINQMGVKQVLITLGGDGAVLVTNEEIIHQPAFTVDAVDTTAAGDTFVGYFATAIINGLGLKQALVNSCGAAALAVTKVGAQSSIPCNEDTQSFVQKYTTEGVR